MDQHAEFVALIQQNTAILYKVAGLYTETTEDREDLLQEMIYQLWKSYGTFAGRARASTWIYRVGMNVAIHHLKREKRRPLTVPLGLGTPHPVTEEGETDDRWTLLRQHIGQLNLLERGILFLFLENKSYAEIAEITGLSVTNVGTRLGRIRQKLKTKIHETETP